MTDLIVVCSITDQECYENHLKDALTRIGTDYTLVLTNSSLSLCDSYNSIIETNLEDIKQSKYILFMGQDLIIKGEEWGRKLVNTLDTLSDFGYGGVDCMNKLGGVTDRGDLEEVETCDAGIIIIPSKLFLERQFDTQFPWYPLAEDYACWTRLIKNLKVYHVPIEGFQAGQNCKPSGFCTRFDHPDRYRWYLRDEHFKLLDKWDLNHIFSTTAAFRGGGKWTKTQEQYQVWKRGMEQRGEKVKKEGEKKKCEQ